MAINFTVNGRAVTSDAPGDTPLLWVLREGLKLTGTKFGCGAGMCGACMVHVEGKRAYTRERLQPGMRVSAVIKTGDRRVIEYILSPVMQAVSEAGRER